MAYRLCCFVCIFMLSLAVIGSPEEAKDLQAGPSKTKGRLTGQDTGIWSGGYAKSKDSPFTLSESLRGEVCPELQFSASEGEDG